LQGMFAEKWNFDLRRNHDPKMSLSNAVFSIVQPKLGKINMARKILMASGRVFNNPAFQSALKSYLLAGGITRFIRKYSTI
jgi:hypothetical protein